MKVISYAIFRAPCEKFEFMAYLRGLYFNARMNRLIYPEWKMIVYASSELLEQYYTFWVGLASINKSIEIIEEDNDVPLCKGMLWRILPIFMENVTHVICRDADAITTYREAVAVNNWAESDHLVHAILDNPSHSGLMGGMVGFKTEAIKAFFKDWNHLVSKGDLRKRGSDQELLNKYVLPPLKNSVLWSKSIPSGQGHTLKNVNPALWESELTCRHIGSAGVVEMETLRFFKRFDKTDYSEFEKQHSDICYWARN